MVIRSRCAKGFLIGISVLVLLTVALVADVARGFTGKCGGSIFPFLGDAPKRDCSLAEYMKETVPFSLAVVFDSFWPLAVLIVAGPALVGWAMDRKRSRAP